MNKKHPLTDSSKPASAYCRLYVVRHAESEGNRLGLIQGHADYDLSETGKETAAVLAKKLKGISFDAVFASDLTRAAHTAEILASEHKLVVKTTELLREQNFGAFNGQQITQFREELKELLEHHESLVDEERFVHRIRNDIESDSEVVSRSFTFLREVALAYAGQTVLVVSHASALWKLLIHLGFATYKTLRPGGIKNLAYFVADSDGIEFFVRETSGIHLTTDEASL